MKDSDKSVDGQSFYAEHLTGSGTIQEDGTYGEPEPDPTVKRGGPAGERKSPGGVKRPDPNETAVPEQRSATSSSSTTKARNQRA